MLYFVVNNTYGVRHVNVVYFAIIIKYPARAVPV